MANGRLKVALIFGGRSAEHEVSLRSACSIFEAMDRDKYEVAPVLITHEGAWYQRPAEVSSFDPEPSLPESDRLLFSPDPAHQGFLRIYDGGRAEHLPFDVVFPVL
ncbi:MAG: D-alanine--D-alanine ligase A, partial [Desulfomonilaceae bacterium]